MLSHASLAKHDALGVMQVGRTAIVDILKRVDG